MRANLDAAGGLPLAEHVAAAAGAGPRAARGARPGRGGQRGRGRPRHPLGDALTSGEAAAALAAAGISPDQIDAALDPAAYLGSAAAFTDAALAAHRESGARAVKRPGRRSAGDHEKMPGQGPGRRRGACGATRSG